MQRESMILVCGGTSEERRVSVASAQNIARVWADTTVWFIAPERPVHVCGSEVLCAHEHPFEADFDPKNAPTYRDLEEALHVAPAESVLFLALHGGEGENGVIQRHLEARALAFTGSGFKASELAFDKLRAKETMAAVSVQTARSWLVHGSRSEAMRVLSASFLECGRLVVKPVSSGSSFGLHHVATADGLADVADAVVRAGVPFLAEEFVCGTELTVGVVDQPDGPTVALPVSEIRLTIDRTFDYDSKYLGRGAVEITPAEVSPETSALAREIALLAHRQIGCEGYSRTDLIAAPDGLYFLEINTLPGLTSASFLPQQLAAAGRTMGQFIADQVALAKRRRDGRHGRTATPSA
jgi:D-alanine-D-alanine ligase